MPLLWAAARLFRLLVTRVRVQGLEHLPARGPYLLCPNHQSFIDPFVLGGVLPYRTFVEMFAVGAAEYFQTPLMAWVARQINVVPVDADASLVPAMKASAFGLAHGKVLLLFPEGERSIDGTVKRFKKGAPILAQHLGVPIVPVALRGLYEIWPRGQAIDVAPRLAVERPPRAHRHWPADRHHQERRLRRGGDAAARHRRCDVAAALSRVSRRVVPKTTMSGMTGYLVPVFLVGDHPVQRSGWRWQTSFPAASCTCLALTSVVRRGAAAFGARSPRRGPDASLISAPVLFPQHQDSSCRIGRPER